MQKALPPLVTGLFLLFDRHGGQSQPAERRRHPGQGEDNPESQGRCWQRQALKEAITHGLRAPWQGAVFQRVQIPPGNFRSDR